MQMYCRNCGSELMEGVTFCAKCGAKCVTTQEIPIENHVETSSEENLTKHFGKKIAISIIAVVGIILIAVVGLVIKSSTENKEWQNLCDKIDSYEIPYIISDRENLENSWKNTGIFEFSDRKKLMADLTEIENTANEVDGWIKENMDVFQSKIAEKGKYELSDGYANYENYLEECVSALEEKDYEKAIKLVEEADNQLQELIGRNNAYVEDKLNSYNSLDMTVADIEDKTNFESDLNMVRQLASEEKFDEIPAVFEQLDEIAYQYVEPEFAVNINVQQIDASNYPNIKLYLQIEDKISGEVPLLDNTLFFIRKQDANANYVKQQISKVSQLNEAEALNIDMVADVSGSMNGQPLYDAQTVMSNFISSVQFAAGDKVELISFSTGVYLEEEFTNSSSTLINKINSLRTDNMTSLYDALYTAVTRVASQSGAKCVIAFTDGLDNYSACSSQDVIDVAQRYHVPIFIIGIDTKGYSEIYTIATQTGGQYYEISTVTSMSDIYNEIYKQEKELYLVEFEDTTGSITSKADILVGYHSKIYGGDCNYSYTPNVLLSVEGNALYKDGPEAVVEGYMRGFDDAMTNSDFSAISGYLKTGSSIYVAQEKYVMRSIAEMLDSYEIVSVDYENSDTCIVTTRETYYVQKEDSPLELLTQQCKYRVAQENGNWKITDFADSVKVLSRVNQ